MKMRLPIFRHAHAVCAGTGVFAAALLCAADMSPDQRAFFESRIRPVLVKQCYECHSASAKKIGGKLLLDSPAEMFGGGESGPALIPGKPDESLIIQAIRYSEGQEMPPKKRLPESVVNDFVTWVKMGAPDPRTDAPKTAKKEVTTDKAALWSFQPVTNPPPPSVKAKAWSRDPIDSFVLAKMESAELSPTTDATPSVLVRRLHFDLTGLPPSAEEVRAFVSDYAKHGQLAVERLMDSLLASPHFGERWGRHWLDVARFAESNGNDGLSRNPSFPHAWRYRDYVIRAFNDDVPYDRFITEQIAGDLLPADSPAQRDRQLIATGFLAIGAKPAKAMNDNFEMDVVADQIGAIGSGIMGLSVACARCHDHKHDPIPTRDYYALAGIFKSTETLWGAAAHEALTAPQTPLHELQAAPKIVPPADAEQLKPARASKRKPAKPAFPYAPGTPLAMGLREAKVIADCKLNIDGESKKLGASIPRGFLSACGVTDAQFDAKQSGRLQLAEWLTRPEHPQTARVMVNRVWQHLFGQGLVRTPDDFGVYGDRPSHPELLDHLATRFVKEGWSVKRLIRGIVLSRTYQLGSECDERMRDIDPDNTLLARHDRRRLDAEALRDAMLAASGELDARPAEGSLIQHHDLLVNEMGDLHQPSNHRSIYLLLLRNSMPPELTPFNLPSGTAVTGKRDITTLPTQALYLLNSPFVIEQSKRLAARLLSSSTDDAGIIRDAYQRTLAREPVENEIRLATEFLRATDAAFSSGTLSRETRRQTVWAAFCQALLSSNELRYVD
jgi:hypothetical protein